MRDIPSHSVGTVNNLGISREIATFFRAINGRHKTIEDHSTGLVGHVVRKTKALSGS